MVQQCITMMRGDARWADVIAHIRAQALKSPTGENLRLKTFDSLFHHSLHCTHLVYEMLLSTLIYSLVGRFC